VTTDLVVGCPVWDRAWSLPLWFDSVLANVQPERTGLAFVIPANDYATREVIAERCTPFAWCEVVRDRYEQFDREHRQTNNHASLAQARNHLLAIVNRVGPAFYASWDSDLLLAPGVMRQMLAHRFSVSVSGGRTPAMMTVWTWLNRQPPTKVRKVPFHGVDEYGEIKQGKSVPAWTQVPMAATVMRWEAPIRAHHLDPRDWDRCAQGFWPADVGLAIQMMDARAYKSARYSPHVHGEDIPFNWSLKQRDLPVYCYGEQPGVHLAIHDHRVALQEAALGYPAIMTLAEQKPLAAEWTEPRDEMDVALGMFPITR
jgi:hypothetical protein